MFIILEFGTLYSWNFPDVFFLVDITIEPPFFTISGAENPMVFAVATYGPGLGLRPRQCARSAGAVAGGAHFTSIYSNYLRKTEREREGEGYVCIYIFIFIYSNIYTYVYIYIYTTFGNQTYHDCWNIPDLFI